VVTVNYRLGAFGFIVNPALSKEDPNFPTTGNVGLLDQAAAMQWVVENIAAFGCNPQAITVFGESAGSISLCLHMIMPLSKGLFRSIILESGPCLQGAQSPNPGNFNFTDQQSLSNALIAIVNCTNADPANEITCLRSLNASTIIAAQATVSDWGPVIDGLVIPDDPLQLWKQGKTHETSVLAGTNLNEGTMFVPQDLNDSSYRALLNGYFPSHGSWVYDAYPTSAFPSAFYAAAAAFGDFYFVCPTRRLLSLQPAGTLNFQYVFAHMPSWILCPGYFCNNTDLGVAHTYELYSVWGWAPPFSEFTPTERTLSAEVIAYWTSFASLGKPVGPPTAPNWPSYDRTTQAYLLLNDTSYTSASYDHSACDFWDSITS